MPAAGAYHNLEVHHPLEQGLKHTDNGTITEGDQELSKYTIH